MERFRRANISDIKEIEKVPLEERMPFFNTYDMLKHGAAIDPEAKAISFIRSGEEYADPVEITYREFLRKVTQSANLFHSLGVERDDVVSMVLPNFLEYHFIYWGAEAAGIVNPLNYMLEPSSLAQLCDSAKTRILVIPGEESGEVGADIWRKAMNARKNMRGLKAIVLIKGRGDKKNGVYSYDDIIDGFQGDTLDSRRIIDKDDISSMLYTGGTTGAPKLALRTHLNETSNPVILNMERGMPGTGETILGCTPLFHTLATVAAGSLAFSVGGHVTILTPIGFRDDSIVKNFYKIVELYRGVCTFLVPTMLLRLLDVPISGADLSSLRWINFGGATLSVAIVERFETKSGIRVTQGYGMTEATSLTSMDPLEGERRIGSMGLRLPYVQQKIFILDDSGNFVREAQSDEIGTVCLSGPTIMKRYMDTDQNSRAWVKGEWLNSGDLARKDPEGYFWFTGRSKELIRRSGHNIDPAVVEHSVHKLAGIHTAAAVAKPDPYAGETVCLYVQLKEDSDLSKEDIMAYLRENMGERAAVPKEVVIIDKMPLTPVGKIFKPSLKWDAIKRAYEIELSALEDDVQFYRVDVAEDNMVGTLATVILKPKSGREDEQLKTRVNELLASYSITYRIEIV